MKGTGELPEDVGSESDLSPIGRGPIHCARCTRVYLEEIVEQGQGGSFLADN
jgi:hypothetical protein